MGSGKPYVSCCLCAIFAILNHFKKEILKKPVVESLVKAITLPGSSQTIGDANALTNVQLIGKEIVIDLALASPSLQSRKKIESHVGSVLHDKIREDYTFQVHVTHQKSPTAVQPNIIKGNALKASKISLRLLLEKVG